MGIFNWLDRVIQPQKKETSPSLILTIAVPTCEDCGTGAKADGRRAECPSCHHALKKIPERKQKCPFCQKFMLVRTQPNDRVRVIVTEDGAQKIDDEWDMITGRLDAQLAKKKDFEDEKEYLKNKRHGHEPSDNDVNWSMFNKDLRKQASNKNWGGYRNTRSQMAALLASENKLKAALATYLEVCYWDLNFLALLDAKEKELADFFQDGRPHQRKDPPGHSGAMLAPGIVKIVGKLAKKLTLQEEEIHLIFVEGNSGVAKNFRLPRSVEECWPELEESLSKFG